MCSSSSVLHQFFRNEPDGILGACRLVAVGGGASPAEHVPSGTAGRRVVLSVRTAVNTQGGDADRCCRGRAAGPARADRAEAAMLELPYSLRN